MTNQKGLPVRPASPTPADSEVRQGRQRGEQAGLVPILIIVLIALSLGGYLIYRQLKPVSTPQPTTQPSSTLVASPAPSGTGDTTNWKNIAFNNLNFKIPPGYQSGYLGSSSVFAIDPQPIPQTSSYGDFTPAFSLELIKNKTLDQTTQEFLNQKGYTNKKTSNVTIAGKPGLKTTEILPPGQDTVDHHVYDVYLSVGQDLYHFGSFDLHISATDQQKYFDQILSTFKFTQ